MNKVHGLELCLRRNRAYGPSHAMGRNYTEADVQRLRSWLEEREAGYPKRNLPWHEIGCLCDGTPVPKPTIATRSG